MSWRGHSRPQDRDSQMEFHIKLHAAPRDVDTVRDAIQAVDPAAVVDIDSSGQSLRVAAAVDSAELLTVIRQAGYALDADRVIQIPSVCCGGCGG